MKEKKKARMRDGYWSRKLFTVYFYNGWYAVRGASIVHFCRDSSYIHDGGNLFNVPSNDIFNLGDDEIKGMGSLIKYVNEYERY